MLNSAWGSDVSHADVTKTTDPILGSYIFGSVRLHPAAGRQDSKTTESEVTHVGSRFTLPTIMRSVVYGLDS